MTAFKEYCALAFLKGSLLQDKFNLLKAPGEHSQAARQFRFTNVSEILELESTIKQYIDEAIKLEKAGAKIDFKAKTELEYPEELIGKLADDAGFKKAFEALTPGRKRAYVIFFSAPKQSSTRISRIEKSVPGILIGKGWNER